jgi:hypothetical protein
VHEYVPGRPMSLKEATQRHTRNRWIGIHRVTRSRIQQRWRGRLTLLSLVMASIVIAVLVLDVTNVLPPMRDLPVPLP